MKKILFALVAIFLLSLNIYNGQEKKKQTNSLNIDKLRNVGLL